MRFSLPQRTESNHHFDTTVLTNRIPIRISLRKRSKLLATRNLKMKSTLSTMGFFSLLVSFGAEQAFRDAFTGSEAQQVESMMTSEMPFHPFDLSPMSRKRFKCPRYLIFAFECEC